MKSIFVIISVVIFLGACNSAATKSDKEKKFEIKTTKTYVLTPESSKLSWNRQVDYKSLQKRVKMFGAYVDVSMENVQLETSGDAKVSSGNLVCINDIYTAADIEIDLSLTRFYSDDEESFFKTETYPAAKLSVKSFEKDTVSEISYIAIGDLTLNNKTQSVKFPVDLKKDESSNIIFNGTYLMHTADWPVLKQPKPENVNYDEISFGFDLIFGNPVEKVDTVYAK